MLKKILGKYSVYCLAACVVLTYNAVSASDIMFFGALLYYGL